MIKTEADGITTVASRADIQNFFGKKHPNVDSLGKKIQEKQQILATINIHWDWDVFFLVELFCWKFWVKKCKSSMPKATLKLGRYNQTALIQLESNISPENGPGPKKETSIPTIHFQGICQFQGGQHWKDLSPRKSASFFQVTRTHHPNGGHFTFLKGHLQTPTRWSLGRTWWNVSGQFIINP